MNRQRDFEDAALARALIAHEPAAPGVVWRRFAPTVFRILRRTLGSGPDVEDLVQDIFLCVFKKVSSLREHTAFRTFVVSVTIITARCEVRRRAVQKRARLAAKDYAAREAVVHPDTDAREALQRFCGVLERINVRDRRLFVLRFIEDLPLGEAARACGLSLATTKRRLVRTWSKVRLLVERDPVLFEYVT